MSVIHYGNYCNRITSIPKCWEGLERKGRVIIYRITYIWPSLLTQYYLMFEHIKSLLY